MDKVDKGDAVEESGTLWVLLQGLEPLRQFLGFVLTLISDMQKRTQTNPGHQILRILGNSILEHIGGRLNQFCLIFLTLGNLLNIGKGYPRLFTQNPIVFSFNRFQGFQGSLPLASFDHNIVLDISDFRFVFDLLFDGQKLVKKIILFTKWRSTLL